MKFRVTKSIKLDVLLANAVSVIRGRVGWGGGGSTHLQSNLRETKSHIARASQLRSVVRYEGDATGQA